MGKSRTVFKGVTTLVITVSFLVLSYSISLVILTEEPAKLQVAVLDVGQGSSIYIKTPYKREILIDTGRDMESIRAVSRFRPFYDRYLDYVLVSHGDYDHMAMLPYILRSFKVGTLGWFSQESSEGLKNAVTTAVNDTAVPTRKLHQGDALVLGADLYLQVVWPPQGYTSQERNNTSLVLRLVYQDTTFLFPGDIEQEVEQTIVEQTNTEIEANVLVVAHHGSKSSSAEQFIAQVNPEVAIIQAGVDNQYGHPHRATLETLKEQGVVVLTTAQQGNVLFVSDGEQIVYNTQQ